MEQGGLLADLLIVYAVAGLVAFVFHRLRVPTLVGLLLAGVVVGPYGLGLVADVDRVKVLAEVGVVILLFTVGLEFSLSQVLALGPTMLAVGVPQVLGCGIVAYAATEWHLGAHSAAIFAGMLVAMSSTAVVMKLLADRGEINSPFGRIAVAVLLFQDLLVTFAMMSLPLLAGKEAAGGIWRQTVVGLAVVIGILVAIRFAIPPMLYQLLRTRNREIFIIAILLVCLGTASLTAWAGLSLALGAFLAGLALSDSEYAHQTLAEVLPFRDALASLFFVSVGMLLDVGFVTSQWLLVLVTVVALVLLKFVVVAVPLAIAGHPMRTILLAGLALAQIGEFSFVLANRGVEEFHLLSDDDYQVFLAAAVITMALTPISMAFGPRFVDLLERRFPRHAPPDACPAAQYRDHVIIAGYGLNGQNVARVLRDLDLPYVILEMNPTTVRARIKRGEPIVLGDCSRPALLEHVGIRHAKALVVVISDPSLTRRTVQVARSLSRKLHIIVRTRYVSEVEDLRKLGASEIIPEEFETSVEIFARVLERFSIPRNLILDLADRVRHDHYEVLRDQSRSVNKLELPVGILGEIETETCLLRASSPAVGRSPAQLTFRTQTGATIIAVRRNDRLITNPAPDFRLDQGDIVVLLGNRPQLDRAVLALDPNS